MNTKQGLLRTALASEASLCFVFFLSIWVSSCAQSENSGPDSKTKLTLEYAGSFVVDTAMELSTPHPYMLPITTEYTRFDKSIFLIGIDKASKKLIFRLVDSLNREWQIIPHSPEISNEQLTPFWYVQNSFMDNGQLFLYTKSHLIQLSKPNDDELHIDSIIDINQRLGISYGRYAYKYRNKSYLLTDNGALMQAEGKRIISNQLKLLLYEISADTTRIIWQMDFFDDLTHTADFRNVFFKGDHLIYFSPFTYQCHKVSILTGEVDTFDYAERANFVPTDVTHFAINELDSNSVIGPNNFRESKDLNDRIYTVFQIDEGYLIYRTKYPNKEQFQLDFIPNDLSYVSGLNTPFLKFNTDDIIPVRNFEQLPIDILGRWVAFVDDKMIIAFYYVNKEPMIGVTGSEVYEQYNLSANPANGRVLTKIFFYRYTIK